MQADSPLSHSSLSSTSAGASVLMSQPSVDASSSPPSSSSSGDEDGSGDRRGGGGTGRMSNLLGHADRLIDVAEHDVQVARGYAAASGSGAAVNKQEQFNPAFR